jgi:hypothetical protein
MEDLMYESVQIALSPIRKEHSKRAFPPYMAFVQYYYRKRIETSDSLIKANGRQRPWAAV